MLFLLQPSRLLFLQSILKISQLLELVIVSIHLVRILAVIIQLTLKALNCRHLLRNDAQQRVKVVRHLERRIVAVLKDLIRNILSVTVGEVGRRRTIARDRVELGRV